MILGSETKTLMHGLVRWLFLCELDSDTVSTVVTSVCLCHLRFTNEHLSSLFQMQSGNGRGRFASSRLRTRSSA